MIKVLGARVLVKEDKNEEATSGGIVIPGREKEKTFRGTIVAVGKGAMLDDGTIVPMDVTVGNRIVYTDFSGTPIKAGDEGFIVLNERDILAVIE